MTTADTTIRGVRRATVIAIVAALVVAAVLGIFALLGAGIGALEWQILSTSALVAVFGTTCLCHLAVVTRAVRVVGYVGVAASVGAAACALVLIWSPVTANVNSGVNDGFVVLAVAAASLAQTNLLLLLAGRRHPAIRAGLAATLAAIAVVGTMIVLPIVGDLVIGEGYGRWLGVFGILDALGTIALPVLGLVLRGPTAAATTVRLVLDLPPALLHRLDAQRGERSREAIALAVLDRDLDS